LAYVVTIDLPRARAEHDASATVDPANVWAADAERCAFQREPGRVLCLLHGALNGSGRLVEFGNGAFAHAARIADAVSAIAQARVGSFSDEDAGLGAAYIHNSNDVLRYFCHFSDSHRGTTSVA